MKFFDIVIIGGGPAGSTCALALANSGLSVAVVEKAVFPRNKVCGDAVAAYVPKVLKTLHPKYGEALKGFIEKAEVNTCRFIAPNRKFIDIASPEPGFITTRMEWDHFLYRLVAAEPNITWFLDHEVTEVTIDRHHGEATVTTKKLVFKSKVVIGCDGAHSLSGKQLTVNKPDLTHYAGAVRAYYKNVTGFAEKTYELHFLESILPGYFWIFPLPGNMANVGVCIPSSTVSKKKLNLRQVMNDIICNDPAIKERFAHAELSGKVEGYGLPLGSVKKVVSGDHFMICGDAASLIDPATGEGIGQSMISGRYAGWQAIRCFQQNNFSAAFMKQYDQQLYGKLWRNARNSYHTRNLVYKHPLLFNGFFNLLDRNKLLKKMVLQQVVKVAAQR